MKILLIGKNGQLGWELRRTLATLGDMVALDYPDINLAEEDSLRTWIHRVKPNLIVNAAAYTAVDQAESEPELAMAINGVAPGILAEEARQLGAVLVHYSSDYVFNGQKGEAYVESDPCEPLNVYGLSKLAGDQNIEQVGGAYLILRPAWVYSMRQGGFVQKVLSWAHQNPELRIVSDQIGSPTWARLLAEATAQVLVMGCSPDLVSWVAERSGTYHLAGSGAVSRLDWARAILKYDPAPQQQRTSQIGPARTAEFPTPARRPLNTPLNCKRFNHTFGIALPDWEMALQMAMDLLQ
ncbi:MAG: dTDP-4-dehydrorhamnose reductase [Anaerolineales bacterium]|nr:dTDP-4-dehydrorhamnose reductase [Anaerolineales bacterium]